MTASYTVPLTCPRCGADVEHVTSSRVISNEASAICRCSECRVEWQLAVALIPVVPQPFRFGQERSRPSLTLCGTDSGYQRHCRTGTEPCQACKDAHARSHAARLEARRGRESSSHPEGAGEPWGWERDLIERRQLRERLLAEVGADV